MTSMEIKTLRESSNRNWVCTIFILFSINMLFPIVLLGIETIDLNGPGSTTPFSGFDSLNVNFIGNWPFGGSYSLAIGQSENLIFLGSGGGVYILDVSQPLQPIEISDLVRARGLLGNTRVNGFYTNGGEIFYDSMRKLLFLASGIGGIEIWNVDNPLQPQRQCRYITQGYPIDIFILGNYAFIADYKEGFLILDISNANSPTQIAFYALPEIRKVSVLGDFAYVLNGGQGDPGLLIFDLSNIANPTQIGYCPGASGTALDIQIDYPYAYVTRPFDGLFMSIDVNDPTNPFVAGMTNTYGYPLSFQISNSHAFIACDFNDPSGGLSIVDIQDPENPVLVGYHYTIGAASDAVISGSYAFISDGWYGMALFDISDVTNPLPIHQGDFRTPAFTTSVEAKGEYAYVASQEYFKILDISNCSLPREMASIHTFCTEVCVQKELAFIGAGTEFKIINITNPFLPQIISTLELSLDIQEITASENFVYVTGIKTFSNPPRSEGCLQIIDISNPSAPVLRGFLSGGSNAMGIHLLNEYAYVCWNPQGLWIIDISNPDNPQRLVDFPIYGGSWGIDVDWPYAYVAAGILGGLRIVDISELLNPLEVSYILLSDYAMSVFVFNSYAYIAANYSGLRVIDISDPLMPLEKGYQGVPGRSLDVKLEGNRIFIADDDAGIQIFKNPLSLQGIDDPLSLAYNGNHHLKREPNSDNLHLVYTHDGKVWYRNSTNGGKTWSSADELARENSRQSTLILIKIQ